MTKGERNGDLTNIRNYLSYNPETGIFMWIKRKRRSKVILNVPVLNDRGHGYLRIKYNGTTYCVHRLAWWWVHCVWPSRQIDHINGNKQDNRIINLRDVTAKINNRNHKIHREGKILGVYFSKKHKKWELRYLIKNTWKFIGYFDNKKEAEDKAKLRNYK